ncbi:hypothetical protein ACUNWD_18335 [Sunxiuqinia sp. A32]
MEMWHDAITSRGDNWTYGTLPQVKKMAGGSMAHCHPIKYQLKITYHK